MEITDIDKSIKRANSGGTFKFFQTKYLNLDNDIYRYELTFSDKCNNPFKTIQGGMIASALAIIPPCIVLKGLLHLSLKVNSYLYVSLSKFKYLISKNLNVLPEFALFIDLSISVISIYIFPYCL
jgi:hypothetical protein